MTAWNRYRQMFSPATFCLRSISAQRVHSGPFNWLIWHMNYVRRRVSSADPRSFTFAPAFAEGR